MREQLATLRMGTLSANRNAVADNVDDGGASQRAGTARATAWQRKASTEIPPAVPCPTFRSPGAGEKIRELDWNPLDGVAPEIDPVVSLSDEDLEAVYGGATDAAPERPWTDFFNNGKPYAENVREYNEYLASNRAR
jgi:hypothetical protein